MTPLILIAEFISILGLTGIALFTSIKFEQEKKKFKK